MEARWHNGIKSASGQTWPCGRTPKRIQREFRRWHEAYSFSHNSSTLTDQETSLYRALVPHKLTLPPMTGSSELGCVYEASATEQTGSSCIMVGPMQAHSALSIVWCFDTRETMLSSERTHKRWDWFALVNVHSFYSWAVFPNDTAPSLFVACSFFSMKSCLFSSPFPPLFCLEQVFSVFRHLIMCDFRSCLHIFCLYVKY